MRETFLPYYRPDTTQAEVDAVGESIRNGWLTTGLKVKQFEEAFAAASGTKHAIALNSCTAALHIGLIAAGVGPGDEVVMPSLTFVAGAQCALEIGATPIFCDVDQSTLSISLETVAAVITPKTKVIIAMPYAGRPIGIAELVAFARERGIVVIEDAAHGAGMLDRGEWAGTHSALAAYSFYATKNLTTAEGGMLLTNDDAIAGRAHTLSLHGMDRDAWKRYTDRGSWRYDVLEPGFKYNMPDIAAALGLVQLGRLPQMQARREALVERYRRALEQIRGVECQTLPLHDGDRHSWCMFVVRITPAFGISRDELIERLRNFNIGTSVHYIPTHHFSGYRRFASPNLRVTDEISKEILSFPLFNTMTERDVDDVVEAVQVSVNSSHTALAS